MKNIEERLKMSWQGWFYAVQRIDLLLISISSAGVYVVLEAIKYSAERHLGNIHLLKASGLIFVVSIVVNFLSQFTGKKANEHDMKMQNRKLNNEENELTKREIRKHDYLADIYTKWTNILNVISILLMTSGLIVIMIYFMITF